MARLLHLVCADGIQQVTRLFVAVAVVGLVVIPARYVSGGEPTDQLKRQVDMVVKTLASTDLPPEQRRATIRKEAEQIFDFEETARRALGRHWQSRTPAERKEFVRLFADLLESSYVSKIDQYHGERILYQTETLDGDQATVKTRIQTPKGSDIPIDYRMKRGDDNRWLVYDVVIEGVSLVSNYRTQFNKIIQTSSYEELVQKLRTRALSVPETPAPRRG